MSRRAAIVEWLALVPMVLPIAACNDDPVPPPVLGPRTAEERGAELFTSPALSGAAFNTFSCALCHEAVPTSDPTIRPGAPLAGAVDRPSYWGGAEIDLLRAVNHCLSSFMLHDEPWSGSEPEAEDLYAFLSSLPAGEAGAEAVPFEVVAAVTDPPWESAAAGAEVYARACERCHGVVHTGEGRLAEDIAVLPDDTLLDHPLGEYHLIERRLVFVEKVRHGRFLGYGGRMPPFSREKLSDRELGDLLQFFGL
jgi:thiosulfate dehydrogenase